MKTRDFSTDFTIAQVAESFTMADLRRRGYLLSVTFHSKLKKSQLCEVYADCLKENIGFFLKNLSGWELELVRDLVEIGPGKSLALEHPSLNSRVIDILMLKFDYDNESGVFWVTMPDELRKTIGDNASIFLADPEHQRNDKMMQYFRGLVYLYGYSSYTFLITRLSKRFPELTKEECSCHPYEWIDYKQFLFDFENSDKKSGAFDSCFITPELLYVYGSDTEFLKQVRDVPGYKVFSEDEIMNAGKRPYPVYDNAASRSLKTFLMRNEGKSEMEAQRLLYDLWMEKQGFDTSPSDMLNFITESITLNSIDELNDLMNLVMNYTNSLPCWALSGFSSEEVMRMQGPMTRPPKIKIGPNMRKAGISEEDIQRQVNAAFYGDVADSLLYKAGRNDPCPCGSGLKFKNCHGKGN